MGGLVKQLGDMGEPVAQGLNPGPGSDGAPRHAGGGAGWAAGSRA